MHHFDKLVHKRTAVQKDFSFFGAFLGAKILVHFQTRVVFFFTPGGIFRTNLCTNSHHKNLKMALKGVSIQLYVVHYAKKSGALREILGQTCIIKKF